MISGTHVLLLRDAEEARYLPIPIGPNEASAIAYHLQGVTPERPLTHDTALQAIRALGATLREVRITEVREETFRARMVMVDLSGEEAELDARPSDAVALALRADAPIFISAELLSAEGIVPEAAEEERLSLFRDFVNSLDGEEPPPTRYCLSLSSARPRESVRDRFSQSPNRSDQKSRTARAITERRAPVGEPAVRG